MSVPWLLLGQYGERTLSACGLVTQAAAEAQSTQIESGFEYGLLKNMR